MSRDASLPESATPPTRRRPPLLTLALLGATIAGFLGGWHWFLDLASHFRFQLLLVALGPLAWSLLRRHWKSAGLAAAVAVTNGATILPLYLAADAAASPSETLRILYANVNSGNSDHARLLERIRRESPDVILVAELDQGWANSLLAIRAQYPHSIQRPRIDNFGIGAWSRHPLLFEAVPQWGPDDLPSIELRIAPAQRPLTILFTHPLPPMRKRATASRNAQLLAAARTARNRGGGTLLVGDFNATPWSAGYRAALAASGMQDSAVGFGVQPTWPTRLPALLRIPIDHCWHATDVFIHNRRVGPDIGSDHLPLVLDIHR